MLIFNNTKLPQVVNIRNQGFPQAIQPGMVFDDSNTTNIYRPYFTEFKTESFVGKKRVGLVRDFAMGDLVQLIPVARYFKQYYKIKEVEIFTTVSYVKLLKNLFSDLIFTPNTALIYNQKCDLIFNLNGLLEKDHSLSNTENQKHRIEIYLEVLGIKDKPVMNWTPNILKDYSMNITTDKKLIGLQMRGSGHMKTLPKEHVREIASELSKKYYVVLIDQSSDQGFEGKNILNLCGQLSPQAVTAMLSKLDCCITMDSGILWLAHVANCPVLVLLGPTREEERVSLHPSYPEKAKSISISNMIGCNPCFETKARCGGRIRCMKDYNKEQLINEIKNKISEIVGE